MGAYSCSCCQFRVHRACLAKACKIKACWKASNLTTGTSSPCYNSSEAVELRDTHVHQMRFVSFLVPTCCDACNENIKAMCGYQCQDCKYTVHDDCLDRVKHCIILESQSLCLTC